MTLWARRGLGGAIILTLLCCALAAVPPPRSLGGATAQASGFSDDFNDNTVDAAKWTVNSVWSGSTIDTTIPVREINQRLEIGPLKQAVTGTYYNGVRSAGSYDFTGAYSYVELVQATAATANGDAMFTVGFNVNNYYRIYVNAGSLICQKRLNSTKTALATIPYDAQAHKFLRIRHDASNGHVVFETASGSGGAPSGWVPRHSEAWSTSSVPLTAVQFELKAGATDPTATTPETVIFDNFRFEPNSTPPPSPLADIVLYASEAPTRVGNWFVVADSTAAGGARLHNPDAGQPKLSAPSANPANYFEMTFNAEAGRAYRLWLRGRADADFWGNDSTFVQFSGSADAGGAPAYRIGTTSALTSFMEDCCGIQGWGWMDNQYQAGLGPLVYFQQSGAQTIRVQVREDGLSIDQIVLSPETYLNAAPGAPRNDATILPRQPAGAETVYLSDVAWDTLSNGWGPVEKDLSVGQQAYGDGRTLTLNGVTYAKGLGVHANSELVFNLGGNCSTFISDIGVDDEAGTNASVVFQVWADGVKIFDSGLMNGSSATQAVNKSVAGIQQLRLVVTDGGNGNGSDHADWAGARVSGTPVGPNRALVGEWSAVSSFPVVGVHAHVLPNKKVLLWDASMDTARVRVWDPEINNFSPNLSVPAGRNNVFCSGHAFLPDGRLFVPGGQLHDYFYGSPQANFFNYADNSWSPAPNMNAGRWYPTATALGSGDVLVVGGTDENRAINTLPQVWQTASGSWRSLTGVSFNIDLYPRMHLAPNGRVFNSGPDKATSHVDASGAGTLIPAGMSNYGAREDGSSVMYDRGKVLIMGGPGAPTNTTTAEVINLADASPAWRYTGSLAYGRRQLNATLLPDGSVLVTGGTSQGSGKSITGGEVYVAELWNPQTETWSRLASARVPRLYHSTAVLLPDGRVLSAGGGQWGGAAAADNQFNAEIYSPPYLFKGPRPSITSAPSNVGYGQIFTLATPDAAAVSKVSLLRLSSVTHAFNQEQRINFLTFQTQAGGLSVTAPADRNLCPPGYYMLFILNGNGVPSAARVIRIS